MGRKYITNIFIKLLTCYVVTIGTPLLSQVQFKKLEGRNFYELTYGFADNRFKDLANSFVNAQGQTIQTKIENTQLGSAGFAATFQLESIYLIDFDVRYQNTALNGSDGYRVKYIAENNTDERVLKVSYVKSNIGFGLGTPFEILMLGFMGGINMEYGERLIKIDPEQVYLENSGIPQQVSIDSDFLLGLYFKLKLMVGVSENTFICITPSYQKNWLAVDEVVSSVDGFQRTQSKLIPAVESFDIVLGIAFATKLK